ncbi:MAG: DUF3810 domain-containing protein [Eubacterium sp.]|nr:DUF3810 domain-containing protein [Eubacterium sp.]
MRGYYGKKNYKGRRSAWGSRKAPGGGLKIAFIVAAVLIVLTVGLNLLARNVDGFAEWYSGNFYPIIVNTVGRLFGLFPFAVGEFLLYAAIIAAVALIIFAIVKIARADRERKIYVLRTIATALCTLSAVAMIFTLNCGINYFRDPFSVKSGLPTNEKYTPQELANLCVYLVQGANTYADKVTVGSDEILTEGEEDLHTDCVKAMQRLGARYGSLAGFYPQAKGVLFSEFMNQCRILGIYDPFTVEANYNNASPYFARPMTICHELSHLKGFMREDEANFIAYLACRDSGNDILCYSAYTDALIYALNAFHSVASDAVYAELYSYISPQVKAELAANNEFWANYETPVADVAENVNNGYLISQGQSDGTKSYGRFVDLMIYDYKANIAS